MDRLIEKDGCYFIYGDHNNEYTILFQSPLLNDLQSYLNRTRKCVKFFDDETVDPYVVNGKNMVTYFRMYYRDGWFGRWMNTAESPSETECFGVQRVIDYIISLFPNGCDSNMKNYLSRFSSKNENGTRFIVSPNEHYKVMFDTTYGNADYPVRIYVYR